MGRQDQIVSERLKKLDELKKEGINPYPQNFEIRSKAAELHENHKKLEKGKKSKVKTSVAGRVMAFRDFGKISFGVLRDSTGEIQVTLQKGETPDKTFDFFKRYVDSGDVIGVEGTIMRTQRGELSILADKTIILS